MRKVWREARKDRPGWNVRWYDESGHRRAKYFGPKYKGLIRTFMAAKFIELNSDCRLPGDILNINWADLVEHYIRKMEVEGSKPATIRDSRHVLKLLSDSCGVRFSKLFCQRDLDNYLLSRRKANKQPRGLKCKPPTPISPSTINKEVRVIKAFIRFGQGKGWLGRGLEIGRIPAPQKVLRVLSDSEARRLVRACGEDKVWRMRILLLLCTGLRCGDADELRVSDLDLARKTLSARERKTGKVSTRPLPSGLIPEISKYLFEVVQEGQISLLVPHASKRRWNTIRKRAGLLNVTPHDLRRTYASMQAAAGTPIGTVQKLLSHSSIETTMKHYISTPDSAARKSVNALKVKRWI